MATKTKAVPPVAVKKRSHKKKPSPPKSGLSAEVFAIIALSVVLALVLLAAALNSARGLSGASKQDSPVAMFHAADCQELEAAFKKTNNQENSRLHAATFATICLAFADAVEQDGRSDKPVLVRGIDLDNARLASRRLRMRSWSFAAEYPDLPAAVERFLDKRLSNDTDKDGANVTTGGPLQPGDRDKWVRAYRELSACATHVSENL